MVIQKVSRLSNNIINISNETLLLKQICMKCKLNLISCTNIIGIKLSSNLVILDTYLYHARIAKNTNSSSVTCTSKVEYGWEMEFMWFESFYSMNRIGLNGGTIDQMTAISDPMLRALLTGQRFYEIIMLWVIFALGLRYRNVLCKIVIQLA